jgi:galactokinase
MTANELVREVVKYAGFALLAVAVAFATAFFVQQRQVDAVSLVANSNRQLVRQVDNLNHLYAQSQYDECVTRNTRGRQAIKDLAKLVRAHKLDRSANAARIWQQYLDNLKKTPLPLCKKPESP